MDNKDRYFYLGALYAFSITLLIAGLLYYTLTRLVSASYFSMRDDAVVTVSLIETVKEVTSKQAPLLAPPEESKASTQSAEDLFSDIQASVPLLTNSYKQNNEPVVSESFLKNIQTRKEVKETRDHKQAAQPIVDQSDIDIEHLLEQNQAKSGEKNPYYAQVHDILYANWHSTQPNNRAIVKIQISSQGNFSYHVLQWSSNVEFNEELQRHLEYLMQKIFPVPPDGVVRLKVNFISEGKK